MKEWELLYRPKYGHDRFETREMMEARDAYSAPGYQTAPPDERPSMLTGCMDITEYNKLPYSR